MPGRRTGWRRARSRLLAAAVRPAIVVFGLLPWRAAQRLGGVLGSLVWMVSRRDRRRALEHLELAFPDRSPGDRRRIAAACFRHLGANLAEILHVLHRSPETACRHQRVVGADAVERARAEGRPVVLITGHCGNWELISATNLSHDARFSAMARQLDEAALDELAVRLRAHLGTETIARGSHASARQMLRALRSGRTLALLIDQDIATDGVWVPFFGRLANTPRAAAELALRLGATVVPAFDERLPDGVHLVRFLPPLELPDDVEGATAAMTAAIENQIRRCPEQWVWMHRRWRRRPPGETGGGSRP